MTNLEAHAVLNGAVEGQDVPEDAIRQALVATGDAAGSLSERLRRFFEINPDEELMHGDIAAKFSASRRSVDNAVSHLKSKGFIESVKVVRRAA